MKSPPTIYLRKRDPEQPIWRWIAVTDYPVPFPLRSLVAKDRLYIGTESAQSVLDWLEHEHFGDDEPGTARMPVEIVDHFGRPVSLADLATVA
jgi:hypothetical protein